MLCVIAKLDKRSTEKLTAIQKAAAPDADGKPLHGHITLASYMGKDEAGFMAFCAALLKDVSRFAVKYTHLAVLEETSIVAALAEKTGTLAAHRGGLWQQSERMDRLGRSVAAAYNAAV